MSLLSGALRKKLRADAHHLSPIVLIGKQGLTEGVLGSIHQALDDHELIKVKFIEFKEEKAELAQQIEARLKTALVGMIGNIAIFYRKNEAPPARTEAKPRRRK